MNMNTTMPPTNNKLFRQAMHYAIDRNRYVQTVLLRARRGALTPVDDRVAGVRRRARSALRLRSRQSEVAAGGIG